MIRVTVKRLDREPYTQTFRLDPQADGFIVVTDSRGDGPNTGWQELEKAWALLEDALNEAVFLEREPYTEIVEAE